MKPHEITDLAIRIMESADALDEVTEKNQIKIDALHKELELLYRQHKAANDKKDGEKEYFAIGKKIRKIHDQIKKLKGEKVDKDVNAADALAAMSMKDR